MDENININVLSAHPIVKIHYYKIFMYHKPLHKVDLNKMNYLIGPGGVGKTHSSLVAESFLNSIGIKCKIIDLNAKENLNEHKNNFEEYDVLIFDALNESLNPEEIIKQIKEIIDGKKLIIINTRELLFLQNDSNNKFFELDYESSFNSFVNENRIFGNEIKNKLWKTILTFYSPIYSSDESKFKTNLRTLRLLHSEINKMQIVKNNDDVILQIRKAFEQIIKNKLINQASWNHFKYNIYSFSNNEVSLNCLDKNSINILKNNDILRLNNNQIELRDYNFIDHIISLEIINGLIKNNQIKISSIDSFFDGIKIIDERIDNIKGYLSNKTTLKMMTIYQYMFRVANDKNDINSIKKHFSIFIQDNKTRSIAVLTISLMKFSNGKFDFLKKTKIYLEYITMQEYFVLSDFFYPIFGYIGSIWEEDNEYDSVSIDKLSLLLNDNRDNDIFNINYLDFISYLINKNKNSELVSDLMHLWIRIFIESNKINQYISDAIEIKGVFHSVKKFDWRIKDRTTFLYSYLMIIKIIQIFLLKNKKKLIIEKEIFKEKLENTITFKFLNKILIIDTDSLNKNEKEEPSDSNGILSLEWPKSILDDICLITGASTEYHTNNAFLNFINNYSNKFTDKKHKVNFFYKNNYLIKLRKKISETIKLDEYLLENKFKTIKIIELCEFDENKQKYLILGGYDIYNSVTENYFLTIKNKYLDSKKTLPKKFQKSINAILSNTENINELKKNIIIFAEEVINNNIILMTDIENDYQINTLNNNNLNHNSFVLKNEETEIKKNWYKPVLKQIITKNNKNIYFDGNKTIYVSDENYKGERYFMLEKKYIEYEKSFLRDNIDFKILKITINQKKDFVAWVHINENLAFEFSNYFSEKKIKYSDEFKDNFPKITSE